MANFASLWIGNNLSKIEEISLSSYVYYGHSLTLFVYNSDLKVPNGIVKKDANEIIPESKIFKVENSYGPFADMFRYKMIEKTGLIWTDTDCICLKKNWNIKDYMFGFEEKNRLAIGILKMPMNSDLIKFLVKKSNDYNKDTIIWSEIGPLLLTEGVNKFNLFEYAEPTKSFYPIHFYEWQKIWLKNYKEEVLDICKDSYTLHIWNQFLNRSNIDKNKLPNGSAIMFFYDKFVNNFNRVLD